jgi:hypothetical protein
VALIVETGAGLPNADALISVAFADAYHQALGNTAWTGDDAAKEGAIRRATAFMSNSYVWAGNRTKGRAQSLAWPRAGVEDAECYGIKIDEIPIEVKNATAEVALRELVSPGSMNPDFTASAAVKREKVGQLEVEYANASISADAQRPVLMAVRDMIGQFLKAGGGNSLVGEAYRV